MRELLTAMPSRVRAALSPQIGWCEPQHFIIIGGAFLTKRRTRLWVIHHDQDGGHDKEQTVAEQ